MLYLLQGKSCASQYIVHYHPIGIVIALKIHEVNSNIPRFVGSVWFLQILENKMRMK